MGFIFLENCMSKNKKNSLHPCHQHNSSVFRAASLAKTQKQGRPLPQRQKMAEEDPQAMISGNSTEQLTKQTAHLRGRDLSPGSRKPTGQHNARCPLGCVKMPGPDQYA